jgi:6-phosphogluconolactonase
MKKNIFQNILLLSLIGGQVLAQNKNFFLFVGTFTTGKSEGIYVYDFNTETTNFRLRSVANGLKDPGFLTFSANHKFLYSVGELSPQEGTVHSFGFDKKTAHLTLLNTQPSEGERPCHIALDKTEKWVAIANYRGGNVCVYAVEVDGKLKKATQKIQHEGKSKNTERQEKAHAHAVNFSPDNRYLLVPDLGMDKIMAYRFDATTGRLSPAPKPYFQTDSGAGPRHFTFSTDGRFGYVIQELNGTITAFKYKKGTLIAIQTIETLPADYTGRRWSADVHLSPDGRFLYASNRAHESLAVFAVNTKTGKLRLITHQPVFGKTPRNFIISPDGKLVLVANQESDKIVIFRRDTQTGLLTKTSQEIIVPNPVCLKLMEN